MSDDFYEDSIYIYIFVLGQLGRGWLRGRSNVFEVMFSGEMLADILTLGAQKLLRNFCCTPYQRGMAQPLGFGSPRVTLLSVCSRYDGGSGTGRASSSEKEVGLASLRKRGGKKWRNFFVALFCLEGV